MAAGRGGRAIFDALHEMLTFDSIAESANVTPRHVAYVRCDEYQILFTMSIRVLSLWEIAAV